MNRVTVAVAVAAVVILAIGVAAVVSIIAGGQAERRHTGRLPSPPAESTEPITPARGIINLGACGQVDPTAVSDMVVVHIRNNTAVARHYHVTIYFNDRSGERVETGYANAWNVRPGGRVRVEAYSGLNKPIPGLRCEIGEAASLPADRAATGDIWWPPPLQ